MQADMKESVENEWLCARIVEAFGLPATVSEPILEGIQAAPIRALDFVPAQTAPTATQEALRSSLACKSGTCRA